MLLPKLEIPENWPDLPNYELGALSLGLFIAAQAEELGIPADDVPEEFGALVVEHVLGLEASSAKLAALEKALHKAAYGDFESAGRLLREDMIRGATELKFVPIGIKKYRQASEFGSRGAESNKLVGSANRQAVFEAAKRNMSDRARKPSERSLARSIARETGLSEPTVRRHLSAMRKAEKPD